MKNHIMPVPSSLYPRGIHSFKVHVVLLTVLAAGIANVPAQDGPPIPPVLPPTQPPREPTPEELEAQRKAQEAHWQKNLERFTPWLHESDAKKEAEFAEADLLRRTRLLSEAALDSEKVHARQAVVNERARAAGIRLKKDGYQDGVDVILIGDRLETVQGLGLDAAKTIQANKLWPTGGSGYGLTGSGVTVGMWDTSQVRTTHVEFAGASIPRVANVDSGMASPDNHSTTVAGAIISAGAIDASSIGTAYQAELRAYDSFNDANEVKTEANGAFAIKTSSHAYGIRSGWEHLGLTNYLWRGNLNEWEDYKFGFYTTNSAAMDKTIYDSGYVLPVWAAGNDLSVYGPEPNITGHKHLFGGTNIYSDPHTKTNYWDCLQAHSSAKNILTVGSVVPLVNGYQGSNSVIAGVFTAFGPTDDFRIKPDLVSNGESVFSTKETGDTAYGTYSGTSMAAPSVAGALALLYERYYQSHRAVKRMLASTLKALAIHTADEAGDAAGPDYKFGWGLFNALASAILLDANTTNVVAGTLSANPNIREVQVFNAGPTSLYFYPKGTEPVKVTIVWSDPPGTNSYPQLDLRYPQLVNDIDLRVTSGSQSWFPWVLNGNSPHLAAATNVNHLDNVEQVIINNPSTNLHTILLSHTGDIRDAAGGNLTNQWVSVIITGLQTVPKPQPVILDFGSVGATNAAILWSAVPGLAYRIQHIDEVTASDWTDEGAPYTATTNNVAATVTYTNANAQRFYRVITDN